ncbi:hypothetical protein C8A01DRAFT_43801 [Parachaetomium inaequale]|uniref:Uncharacterized protein n=1 Tax=Parachaetomium inaequale TaxID=2588326 RepID=A0AAN6PM51_9PEZI|nr:hypothetical protein C8A01DRAFT_43801 [Parachaetomium inaequale]
MARNSFELLDADALDLVCSLWQPSLSKLLELFNGDQENKLSHEGYCDYYRRQWYLLAPYAGQQQTSARSPQTIARIIQDIQNEKPREDIIDSLRSTNVPEGACERSINLAVRLLVMMRFGVTKYQVSPRRCLQWQQGSLRDFVHGLFNEPPKLSCEQVRLPKTFDGWSIANVAGIEVAFTDNLADHLLLVDDDTRLLVFHHASFLEYHRSPTSIFPDGLVDETLRTLALLFPQAHLRATHRDTEHTVIDPRLALCGTPQGEDRQIERFHFWRDRLVILKQAYDDATPKTLGQWWHDRRNGVQWYTFWVAILVLMITTFLSVVQAVEGALQVYKAYESPR